MRIFFTLFYVLFGIVLLVVASGLVFTALPRTRVLVCQRLENQTINCQIKHTTAGFITSEVKLERLQNADVTSAIDTTADGDFTYFQVNIKFTETVEVIHPLTEIDAHETKTKVNNFIDSKNEQHLTIESSYQSWLQISIGFAAIIFVIFICVSIIKKTPHKH